MATIFTSYKWCGHGWKCYNSRHLGEVKHWWHSWPLWVQHTLFIWCWPLQTLDVPSHQCIYSWPTPFHFCRLSLYSLGSCVVWLESSTNHCHALKWVKLDTCIESPSAGANCLRLSTYNMFVCICYICNSMDEAAPAGYSDMPSDVVRCRLRCSTHYRLSTVKKIFYDPHISWPQTFRAKIWAKFFNLYASIYSNVNYWLIASSLLSTVCPSYGYHKILLSLLQCW